MFSSMGRDEIKEEILELKKRALYHQQRIVALAGAIYTLEKLLKKNSEGEKDGSKFRDDTNNRKIEGSRDTSSESSKTP